MRFTQEEYQLYGFTTQDISLLGELREKHEI